MSLSSIELRKLAKLKLSPEQMTGVLELLAMRAEKEEAILKAEEKKRSAEAARKRAERAAKKEQSVRGQSADSPENVQGQSADSPEDVRRTSSPLVPPFPPAPPIPPIIPPSQSHRISAREPELEAKLREAAGWQSDPSPNLFVVGPIVGLLDSGADLELDVLDTIRAKAPGLRGRKNWNYFVPAIAEARDRRVAAATVISMPTTSARINHGPHRQKPSRNETFDAIDRRIDEIREAERRAAGSS